MVLSLRLNKYELIPTVQLNRSIFWNGLIEQQGNHLNSSGKTITFPISFSLTSYTIFINNNYNGQAKDEAVNFQTRNLNSVNYDSWLNRDVCWQAKGY